ncbi:MAG: phosphoribosylformylglycinamidine synthase subunit PurL [Candidatus Omnitrophota bacterium]
MLYTIEVQDKPGVFDAVGAGIKKDILDLGIDSVCEVSFIQVYIIEGDIAEGQIKKICEELLIDKISQEYFINTTVNSQLRTPNSEYIIEVAYNPGVMEPVEDSALKGIKDLGIEGVTSFKTAKKYIIKGELKPAQLNTVCEKLLYNKLIQHITKSVGYPAKAGSVTSHQSPVINSVGYKFNLITVDLLDVPDKKLEEISKQGQLFLNLAEMRAIQKYFIKIGRNPTDCELETIAQTWSEHCWHKTFRGKIEYTEKIQTPNTKLRTPKLINNLLKSTIMKATKEINAPWCVSVFKDNSGIITFDDVYNICFKVETHNHPSALEPFGGANTGIGGVIRDPMGTGLGAKPILNTDVFCFGKPDYPFSKLPKGILHPKRIMKGVVSGVRDYGNKMGIPTVNGSILFHDDFVGNPLVYCGTVGILPKEKSFKQSYTGDLIVVAGGRTGRDGIHGATFSSGELTHESETVSSGAVQIGNPIQEKKMLEVILKARDENLYTAITDCGAGGLSSAVGEMAQDFGAEVYLEKVPLKYSGLSYTEIWISESQERMVLSVPKENISRMQEIFEKENVELAVIGELSNTKRLKLYYDGNIVCDLDMGFLHDGIPRDTRKAVFIQKKHKEPKFKCPKTLTSQLLKLLSHYDICSKEWVVRQYDHEVQGGTVLKPLTGISNDGPSDAAIVRPVLDSSKGIIVSNGINFRFGFIDPYWMAASCIDEALRQIISVGGSLKEVAILDNFCWGNPDKPDRLGSLVRAAYGCYDFAKAFAAPFISGKDSLYNEFTPLEKSKSSSLTGRAVKNKSISIPGTLLISAVAIMENINKPVSMYAKQPDDLIYIVGQTYDEMGGSHYYDLSGAVGNSVPVVYPKQAKKIFNALSRASDLNLIKAMHDCSDGGLGIAVSEMAFSGGLGMSIFLSEVPYSIVHSPQSMVHSERNDFVLFSESNSRFVVEVERKKQKEFEKVLKGLPFGLIGCVSKDKDFRVHGIDGKVCVDLDIRELKEAWQKPLRW